MYEKYNLVEERVILEVTLDEKDEVAPVERGGAIWNVVRLYEEFEESCVKLLKVYMTTVETLSQ